MEWSLDVASAHLAARGKYADFTASSCFSHDTHHLFDAIWSHTVRIVWPGFWRLLGTGDATAAAAGRYNNGRGGQSIPSMAVA